MKTFNQFNKDVNEAAVALKALPYAAKAFTKVAPMVAPKIANFASGALKFGTAIPVGLGIANVLQSRGDGESNFDKLKKMREKGEGDDLRKKSEEDAKDPTIQQKIKDALVDATLDYKKGLSVKPGEVKGKRYRTDDMKKGESALDYLNRKFGKQIKKQREQYKKERERNKRNELP